MDKYFKNKAIQISVALLLLLMFVSIISKKMIEDDEEDHEAAHTSTIGIEFVLHASGNY